MIDHPTMKSIHAVGDWHGGMDRQKATLSVRSRSTHHNISAYAEAPPGCGHIFTHNHKQYVMICCHSPFAAILKSKVLGTVETKHDTA